jgi:hypothetical protein
MTLYPPPRPPEEPLLKIERLLKELVWLLTTLDETPDTCARERLWDQVSERTCELKQLYGLGFSLERIRSRRSSLEQRH